MEILNYYSLKKHNTFRIDVNADYYVSISNSDELNELTNTQLYQKSKRLILGGGSNILFTDDFKGIVINIDIKGIELIEEDYSNIIIEAGAGENWHDFVTYCLKNKYYGIENLALIPGKVGAAPVQNIGAYGVEQKDFFYALEGYELQTCKKKKLLIEDCKFSYRDSIFKNELKGKFIISTVQYKLSKSEKPNISYKDLDTHFKTNPVLVPSATNIFNEVIRLRKQKLPIPDELCNAGSFFKNPIVLINKYDELKSVNADVPGYKINDSHVKIPAAWLIEKCGWKGKRIGDAGVYKNHSLILVNYGKAKGKDILNLSEEIKSSVKEKFGIEIENEVNII